MRSSNNNYLNDELYMILSKSLLENRSKQAKKANRTRFQIKINKLKFLVARYQVNKKC